MKHHKLPLLHDHHTHTSIYAALHNCIDLRFVKEKSKALAQIGESNNEPIIVLGWNNSLYDFSQAEIDKFPPLIICNTSLHSFLINSPGRKKFREEHQKMIEHIDDETWVENNIYFILTTLARIRSTGIKQIKAFLDDLLQNHGIWRTEDMLLPDQETLHTYEKAGLLDRVGFWADPDTYSSLDKKSKNLIKGLKIFTDGAIGAKTAALTNPYLTGEKGLLNFKHFELLEQLEQANKPIAIHAIGDLATDQVITAVEEYNKHHSALPAVRIEHCQFISEKDAHRAKELGIILSMQPNFNSDSVMYRDRLPEKYLRNNNPFRMLIDKAGFVPGEDLIFGSDGMPHGIQYALEQSLFPPFPGQELKLEEFVVGYCVDGFEHGSIEIEIRGKKVRVNI